MLRNDGRSSSFAATLPEALRGVRALVLDADGVLMYAGATVPNAADALERLDRTGVPYRVVTNFSMAHRESLAAGMSRRFGRPVHPSVIITASSAAAAYTARHHAGKPLLVLASPDAQREWAGQHLVTVAEADAPGANVAAVVIGDAGDDLSFRNLDIAFRTLRNGAAFIAMHRNLWWTTQRGATLDAGALVVGLEHALHRKATVTGKPSPVVFRQAFRELAADTRTGAGTRLRMGDVAMIGDDLIADVAGAQRIGLRGILVLTGKTDRSGAETAMRRAGPQRPRGVGADLHEVVTVLLAGGNADPGSGGSER